MYFGVSNGRYKSRQLPGRGRGSPPLFYSAQQNAPRTFNLRVLLLREIQRRLQGAEPQGVKKRLPKNPFYTVALHREQLPAPPNPSEQSTFVSFEIMGGGRGERESAGSRWESDKEKHKKGVGYCVQVSGSHWSAESDPFRDRDSGSVPAGLGTQAAAAPGLQPVGESS